jgi:hypothetical protein
VCVHGLKSARSRRDRRARHGHPLRPSPTRVAARDVPPGLADLGDKGGRPWRYSFRKPAAWRCSRHGAGGRPLVALRAVARFSRVAAKSRSTAACMLRASCVSAMESSRCRRRRPGGTRRFGSGTRAGARRAWWRCARGGSRMRHAGSSVGLVGRCPLRSGLGPGRLRPPTRARKRSTPGRAPPCSRTLTSGSPGTLRQPAHLHPIGARLDQRYDASGEPRADSGTGGRC